MINQFLKTVNLVAVNKRNHDQNMLNFKGFANRKRNVSEEKPPQNDTDGASEKNEESQPKKQPHWLRDNKWFKILKALLIAFLLLKLMILFWDELAKLIRSAKCVEKAMAV